MQVILRLVEQEDVVSINHIIKNSGLLQECYGTSGLIDGFQIETIFVRNAGEHNIFGLLAALEYDEVKAHGAAGCTSIDILADIEIISYICICLMVLAIRISGLEQVSLAYCRIFGRGNNYQ